jgi:hypothetical protein
MKELMDALESLYNDEKANAAAKAKRREALLEQLRQQMYGTVRSRARAQHASTNTLHVKIRERLERAVLQAELRESSSQMPTPVAWPSTVPSAGPRDAHVTNSILRLCDAAGEPWRVHGDGTTRRQPVRRASDGAVGPAPSVGGSSSAAAASEAADSNDAWLLSLLVYTWRHQALFAPIREARDVPSYRLEQAARHVRGLLSERRGGARAAGEDGAHVRTARQAIERRGGALSTLLREFDAAFADGPRGVHHDEWSA